ncbi:Gfo/Idh/MocA family oxidoreductase [Roseobacter sp. HKCCD9010]|uniref:Gfo/Idh/MocA family protein n=1 Tax=unclassified Roseobacter TaxID=196798 RepID=UPI001490E7FD|nr:MULTISPECIES: Gfo/Idh/MocA family oxidoreductase [unclassified Roseobacter]MBF9050160.1 Gfo/Idh/MocA family oxidoreductase [Rhodobacterales bacterium HKCCD4356]NNV12403.1 Gfo/Idh/MocA family oxidoreductase [Roseobacter sp. HKCCD7357]NNV16133.1 Gfo/Idh/MocA family oxidoreductase [Roseobacter sp. HKCCD8768]NNV25593.1 Gfo/Idh/MocA family oxidoreductase [Roseobacter sp. HKCCD8192]NNV29849.1 Gfo/Idh/MocA family oxidoreductase [Roseobacter sp. HKCCD9061]
MIRVAIIGAGIGREHLAGYRALPGQFQVRWICDLDTARAYTILGGDTGPEVTTDINAVMRDAETDLIDICLPPHLHVPIAMDALAAGKHVICEKPIAPSLADCDALAEAEARAPGRVFPVFQYRYGPGTAALDALIAAGLAGAPQVASLETHWNRGAEYYAVPWRGTWEGERGGAVLGHAIHNHDLLCRYFGPVAALSAQVATRVNAIETEDCAAISMQFGNGALATSAITLGAASDTTRLRLVFEHLTATSGDLPYAPAEGTWSFTARDPARQGEVDAVVAGLRGIKSGFVGYFAAIADAIAGDTGREVTLDDGRRSIELVTAIYSAARSGERIALPLAANAASYTGWVPEQGTTGMNDDVKQSRIP